MDGKNANGLEMYVSIKNFNKARSLNFSVLFWSDHLAYAVSEVSP